MEYILTEKGLFISIIVPLTLLLMLVIDIGKGMSPKKKKIVTIVWYLVLGMSGGLLYLCKFDSYLCYIWTLIFVFGYPILYGFAKLGDKLNKDLSAEEQKIYNKIVSGFMSIVGCCVIIFVCFGGFSEFIVKELEIETATLSKILYIVLGMLCIFRGVFKRGTIC